MSPLKTILTFGHLVERVDAQTLERGAAYFGGGKVARLHLDDDVLTALVDGTRRYQTQLHVDEDDALGFACDCPVGAGGELCKHVVATGVAFLAGGGEVEGGAGPCKDTPRASAPERIEAYLETLSAPALRALVMETVLRDDLLFEKLLMAASVSVSKDLDTLSVVVRQATEISGFLDWREAAGYADRLDDLASLLEQRIDAADAGLIAIIEGAIDSAEEALQHIDDSNGEVMPAIQRLQHVHVSACVAIPSDRVALAQRLFAYQMDGEWDTYSEVIPAYAEALGEDGLAAYRHAVDQAWHTLTPLTPENSRGDWSSQRYRIEAAMEALAEFSGDVDQCIAVMANNLFRPARFLALATVCAAHGRDEEALSWAEQGMAAFPQEHNETLTSFAIDMHLARGNHDRIEALAWALFEKAPGCEAFFRLLDVAARIGRHDALRDRALAHLWEVVVDDEQSPPTSTRPYRQQPKRGEIVALYLREGDADKMWEAFCGGAVAVGHWGAVAAARGKTHHEEAIALYKRLLEPAAEAGTHRSDYSEAFAVVKAIRALRASHDQLGVFGDELAEIRLTWKRKRNLQKLLDTL